MSIKVNKNFVSSSKYPIKCPNSMNATFITVHNTANDASAENEVKYMNSNDNSVSFHYAVDDKEVIQAVPDNRNAWHCGDGSSVNSGNRTSIGVEICYSKSGGERYKKAEDLAIKFIAQLLKQRGWGIERIRTHKSWTEIGVRNGYSNYVKNCPHRILDEGRWDSFLDEVEKELNRLKGNTIKAKVASVLTKITKKSKTQLPYTRTLKNGVSSGTDIKALQSALTKLGYKCTTDGVFGNGTESQVKKFQNDNKLAVDGIVGKASINAINNQLDR